MNGLLKFITCGSVDDGKSTLIGHMLYDAKLLFTDQEKALILDSKVGSRAGDIDYSLLLDGLMAEREQGITIDVAYRFFATEKRSFIVADAPGHEQYTRNMAVGASFADLALILMDATKGILIQTRRHVRICKMMGIKHFVFVVNKMDLVHYGKDVFERFEKDIRKLAVDFDLSHVTAIPVSATEGDNITHPGSHMQWYSGKTLLSFLEEADVEAEVEEGFLLPIQRVCRPDQSFRGFQGEIAAGKVSIGDKIISEPSGEQAVVSTILLMDKAVKEAKIGQAVTIQLDREIDVSRGCVITNMPLNVTNMFTASILWMDDEALVRGKRYLLKIATKIIPATIMNIKYKIDIVDGSHIATHQIQKNEMALCDIVLSEPVVYDEFYKHKSIGRFILINRLTNMTSACGIVEHSLRRSMNLTWQKTGITREIRANSLGQKPLTLWFTGLSGAGKSTLADAVEQLLHIWGKHTMLLDGDNVRMGLNQNLGFKEQDRIENIRRIAEVAKLMNDAGLIVLTAFISPYAADRERAREIIGFENFIEIYVCTSIEECERRDVKGLYGKARRGQIPNFTGVNAPYEPPENPQIVVDTEGRTIEESADYIFEEMRKLCRQEHYQKKC